MIVAVAVGSDSAKLPPGMLTAQFPTVPTTSWVVRPTDVDGSTFSDPRVAIGGDGPTGYIDGGDTYVVGVEGSPRGSRIVGVDTRDGSIRWDRERGLGCGDVLRDNLIACADGDTDEYTITFVDITDGTEKAVTDPGPYYRVEPVADRFLFAGLSAESRLNVAIGTPEDPTAFYDAVTTGFDGTRFVTYGALGGGVAVVADVSATGGQSRTFGPDGPLEADDVDGYAWVDPRGTLFEFRKETDETTVRSSADDEPVTVPGSVATPNVSVPGSAPEIVISDGVAYDRRTGERLWELADAEASSRPSAVVGGVLVYESDDGLVGVDVRTGTDIWAAPIDASLFSAATDGMRLFFPGPDGLTALEVSSGLAAWANLEGSIPTLESEDDVDRPGERLVSGTGNTLVYATQDYIKGYAPTGPRAEVPGVVDLPTVTTPAAGTPSVSVPAAECPVVSTRDIDVAGTPVRLITTRQCARRRARRRKATS